MTLLHAEIPLLWFFQLRRFKGNQRKCWMSCNWHESKIDRNTANVAKSTNIVIFQSYRFFFIIIIGCPWENQAGRVLVTEFVLPLHAGRSPSRMNIWCIWTSKIRFGQELSPSSKNSAPDPAWSIKIQSIKYRSSQAVKWHSNFHI